MVANVIRQETKIKTSHVKGDQKVIIYILEIMTIINETKTILKMNSTHVSLLKKNIIATTFYS